MMSANDKSVRVVPIINHYCHRTVYFVLQVDYDYHSASLEQLYDASYFASFIKNESSRYAIKFNLKSRRKV